MIAHLCAFRASCSAPCLRLLPVPWFLSKLPAPSISYLWRPGRPATPALKQNT